ncbi:MAG: nucleotidyltransferase family protein [Candidatus Sumerlaeota bacterium]|nr:nucleotidyltransferase family protein [Candidatus Sumerlaeota bacterium]
MPHSPIAHAIVLAAGRSRRMGGQKLLLPFAGQTIIAHVVDQLLQSEIDETHVVVGADSVRIAEALAGRSVSFVSNPGPDADMLSSVRCGLRALPPQCEAVLVALGDQPSITTDLVNEMLRAFASCGKGILVPAHGGRRGHPLLVSLRYRDEILTCYDADGLRALLRAHPGDVHDLPVAAASILSDVDTPEDYRRARTGI